MPKRIPLYLSRNPSHRHHPRFLIRLPKKEKENDFNTW